MWCMTSETEKREAHQHLSTKLCGGLWFQKSVVPFPNRCPDHSAASRDQCGAPLPNSPSSFCRFLDWIGFQSPPSREKNKIFFYSVTCPLGLRLFLSCCKINTFYSTLSHLHETRQPTLKYWWWGLGMACPCLPVFNHIGWKPDHPWEQWGLLKRWLVFYVALVSSIHNKQFMTALSLFLLALERFCK
jgi:hypothetical protein